MGCVALKHQPGCSTEGRRSRCMRVYNHEPDEKDRLKLLIRYGSPYRLRTFCTSSLNKASRSDPGWVRKLICLRKRSENFPKFDYSYYFTRLSVDWLETFLMSGFRATAVRLAARGWDGWKGIPGPRHAIPLLDQSATQLCLKTQTFKACPRMLSRNLWQTQGQCNF
jgi:hypothetical protein